MQRTTVKRFIITVAALAMPFLLASCEQNPAAHDHALVVAFSYAPTPAVVNTPITLLFITEENGMHMSVEGPACELHTLRGVNLSEGEVGHYTGTHTFQQSGTYDVHFSFSFEGAAHEEEFTLTVGP